MSNSNETIKAPLYRISPYDFLNKDSLKLEHLLILNEVEEEDRKKSIQFHVKYNDYFGTLATVLSLLKQQEERKRFNKNKDNIQLLDNLVNDLIYLQENYQIRVKKY